MDAGPIGKVVDMYGPCEGEVGEQVEQKAKLQGKRNDVDGNDRRFSQGLCPSRK